MSRELDELMSSVNTQIQKAISDEIGSHLLPQIQTALNAGSGQMTQNRWNVPSERPEVYPEETYGEKVKKTNRNEQRFDYQNGSEPNLRAYDKYQISDSQFRDEARIGFPIFEIFSSYVLIGVVVVTEKKFSC